MHVFTGRIYTYTSCTFHSDNSGQEMNTHIIPESELTRQGQITISQTAVSEAMPTGLVLDRVLQSGPPHYEQDQRLGGVGNRVG